MAFERAFVDELAAGCTRRAPLVQVQGFSSILIYLMQLFRSTESLVHLLLPRKSR